MARPVRSAAEKARELIAKGFGVKEIDAIGSGGMFSDEEDALNEEIDDELDADVIHHNDESSDDSPSDDELAAANPRLKTYDDDDLQPSGVFKPKTIPGPHLTDRITRAGIGRFTRAIDFFQLFFTDNVFQEIVDNTNLYAWLHIHDKPSYSRPDGAWDPTSIQEIKNLVAIIIFNGFAGRADLERNWSQATLYSGGWARRFLPKNRFKALNGMLHVSRPGYEDENDILAKVRPLLSHMQCCCSTYFQPYRNVSIDERMVRSKGRSPIRQYMPDKPTRFGYKLWCICDASCGYTCNFSVYTGKSSGRSQNGLGYDVVTSLASPYYHQGYHIYCDNYFTSSHLAEDLLKNGAFMRGTIQPWRQGFPQVLKDKRWAKKVPRGQMRYIRRGSTMFLQWADKRVVNMLSTIHSGNGSIIVRRRGRNKHGKYAPEDVRVPKCVYEYNQHMGGVNLADQMIESYNCLVKSTRWWKTLLFHMVDVAILNSYILFKKWHELHPEVPELQRCVGYAHLHFCEELVRQLALIDDEEPTPLYTPAFKRRKSLMLTGPHNPAYTKTRRNCQVCYISTGKQNKSYIKCGDAQCNVHLCLNATRNCFPAWHSTEYDKYRAYNCQC